MMTALLFAASGMTFADEVTFDATTDTGTATVGLRGAFKVQKGAVTMSVSEGMIHKDGHYRVYAGQNATFSVESGTISKIVLTSTTAAGAKQYSLDFLKAGSGTLTVDGVTGTWEGETASIMLTANSKQVRITKAVVTYTSTSTDLPTPSFGWVPSDVNIEVGETHSAYPKSTSIGEITYEVTDPTVCSYDPEKQLVTGLAEGKTTVVATIAATDKYASTTAELKVIVTASTKTETTVTWEPTSLELKKGATGEAKATASSGAEISYTSADETVATYDAESGTVTAVGAGTTTITASVLATDTYGPASADLTVTVAESYETVTVKLEENYEETFLGDFGKFISDGATANGTAVWNATSDYGAKATAYVSKTNYAAESYLTSPYIVLSNEEVNGTTPTSAKLTFSHAVNFFSSIDKAKEETGIEISTDNGATWTALSFDYPSSLSWSYLDGVTVDLSEYLGKTIQLRLKYTSTATKAGTWELKNLVVSVNAKLNPTISWAKNTDETTSDDTEYTAPELTVEPETLKVSYESSNTDVATVNENGKVTIVGAGTATITATTTETDDYASASASYTLNVLVVYQNIAELKEAAADGILKFNDVVVTYVNGNYVFIEDETGAICIFKPSDTYTAGEVLNGQTSVTWDAFQNLPEIKNVTKINLEVTKGDAPEPTVISAEDALKEENLCKYVRIEGAKVENGYVGSLQLYDQFSLVTGSKGTPTYTGTYNIVGICGVYKTTYELFLISMAVPVEISEVGYATLYYSAHALEVPTGVTVTTYTADGTDLTEYAFDGTVIAKAVPVVISGEKETYEFYVTKETGTTPENNQLAGTDEETEVNTTGYLYYVLSTNLKGENVGFYYQVEGGKSVKNGAHKAYLPVPESEGAKTFYTFGRTTGINSLDASTVDAQTAVYYDLQGRRVVNPRKGIYIKGGKKIIVK